MAKKAFDRIKAGLDDALAYAKGDKDRGVEHVVRIVHRNTLNASGNTSAK